MWELHREDETELSECEHQYLLIQIIWWIYSDGGDVMKVYTQTLVYLPLGRVKLSRVPGFVEK